MPQRQLSPRWILFILTGLNLFNYLDRTVLSAVLEPLKGDLHLNYAQGGWLATAFLIGYFVTSPLFGYFGDRGSRKRLIALGIFVWSVGTICTGFAMTFAVMLAFRALVGVGEASYATISPSYISDSYPPSRRNNALTIFYVAIPVGSAIGYVIGGFFAQPEVWRHAFIWAGAPGLALALVLLPFAEPKRGAAEGRVEEAGKLPKALDVLKLFRLPQYMLVATGYVAYTFALGGFSLWAPTYLTVVHGVSQQHAATFFGLVLVVSGLVGTFAGGFAATAWQRRDPAGYAKMLAWSVAASVPLAFAAFLVDSEAWCMRLLAAAIFLVFFCTGPVNTLILETVPINLRASAMALSIFLIHLFGDMWSPLLVGILSDRIGMKSAVLILPAALLVCAALWAVLAWRMRGGHSPSPATT
ncbi:MAG: MFS transporter [Opitutales bacterium]|jgi:MFS family permease